MTNEMNKLYFLLDPLLAGVPEIAKRIKERKSAAKALQSATEKYEKLLKASTKRTKKNRGCVYWQEHASFTLRMCKHFDNDTTNVSSANHAFLPTALLEGNNREKLFLRRRFLPIRTKTPKWFRHLSSKRKQTRLSTRVLQTMFSLCTSALSRVRFRRNSATSTETSPIKPSSYTRSGICLCTYLASLNWHNGRLCSRAPPPNHLWSVDNYVESKTSRSKCKLS